MSNAPPALDAFEKTLRPLATAGAKLTGEAWLTPTGEVVLELTDIAGERRLFAVRSHSAVEVSRTSLRARRRRAA